MIVHIINKRTFIRPAHCTLGRDQPACTVSDHIPVDHRKEHILSESERHMKSASLQHAFVSNKDTASHQPYLETLQMTRTSMVKDVSGVNICEGLLKFEW